MDKWLKLLPQNWKFRGSTRQSRWPVISECNAIAAVAYAQIMTMGAVEIAPTTSLLLSELYVKNSPSVLLGLTLAGMALPWLRASCIIPAAR
jgi:hypothetical protein